MCLIKLAGHLLNLVLLELLCLIYPRLLTGFRMQVFFSNSCFMEFQSGFSGGSLLFLVIERAVLNVKSSQEFRVHVSVPQGFIPDPTAFLLYIVDRADVTIALISIIM